MIGFAGDVVVAIVCYICYTGLPLKLTRSSASSQSKVVFVSGLSMNSEQRPMKRAP